MNRMLLGLMLLGALLAPRAMWADDTDIYLSSGSAIGGEPLVMFVLDYRSNLGSTVCNSGECNGLVTDGYLASAPTTRLNLLVAVLKKVFDQPEMQGLKIGLMMSHDDNCTGNPDAGPTMTNCSNGGYMVSGFRAMSDATERAAFYAKLDGLPALGGGNNGHPFQGKELYFEFFRYLTGQGIYNGQAGYKDFGDNSAGTLDGATDTSTYTGSTYNSPISEDCTKIFTVNILFGVSNQEHDSNDAIDATRANGGMPNLTVNNNNDNINDMLAWLYSTDLADGSAEWVGGANLSGNQNVTSYFISDPSAQAVTMNGYAYSGGTGSAYLLSDDPDVLVQTITNIFNQILSVSSTYVSASVPVNVFNRSQVLDSVYVALFKADADGKPLWNGNVKKLKLATDDNGNTILVDAEGNYAVATDGRIKNEALTFWTDAANLPTPDTSEGEVAGKDGRFIERGGAGQKVPGYVAGTTSSLNSAGYRKVYTDPLVYTNGTAASLRDLNADLTTAVMPDIQTALGVTDDNGNGFLYDEALTVIKFIRGIDVTDHDGDGSTTDMRPWVMGDPLHSRPFPINYGARGSYTTSNPDIRIVYGTNDGLFRMVQNTSDAATPVELGTEVWSFAPKEVMGVHKTLMTNTAVTPVHPYGVDGAPTVWVDDKDVDGTVETTDVDPANWDRVYAYFGLRRGGNAYYALDLSQPDTPKMLWKITSSDSDFTQLGMTFSAPRLATLQYETLAVPASPSVSIVEKKVLIFGGGYNGGVDVGKDKQPPESPRVDDSVGNAIFIVDAETGALVWKAVYNDGAGDGDTTITTAAASNNPNNTIYYHEELNDSIPSEVTVVDTDGDGYQDRIYVGDTGGRVWRVDLIGTDRSQWKVSLLFSVGRHYSATASQDRRFFHRPDFVKTKDSTGNFDAVIIGSGDRANPLGTTVADAFYMFKDRVISGSASNLTTTHASFQDLTDNCLQDPDLTCAAGMDLSNGWRIDLDITSGEKSLSTPLTLGGTIFFTTYIPPGSISSATCAPNEGSGAFYSVNLQDAAAVKNNDTSNDEESGSVYRKSDRYVILKSGGIPAEIVALPPDEILRPDLTVEETNLNTYWRTYWYEVE